MGKDRPHKAYVNGLPFSSPSVVEADWKGMEKFPHVLSTVTVNMVEKSREPDPLLEVGQTVPDFELPQVFPVKEYAKVRLSDYKGKIIALEFWAM